MQKKHYMAIHFWKNDFYTYYYDHIVNPTVSDLYIHLGRVIFHTTEFFLLSPISMSMNSTILILSNIRDFYRLTLTWFFWKTIFRSTDEREIGIYLMIAYTSIDITINYFYCIVIVSQSWSQFVYPKAWETGVFLLALNVSNIGLGLMEMIQLTCIASWLAGFCMVYTGFTWYISDE